MIFFVRYFIVLIVFIYIDRSEAFVIPPRQDRFVRDADESISLDEESSSDVDIETRIRRETSETGTNSKYSADPFDGGSNVENVNLKNTDLTTVVPDSGDASMLEKSGEGRESSQIKIRSAPTDETSSQPEDADNEGGHQSSGNDSNVETRAARAHDGNVAFRSQSSEFQGGDDASGKCCRPEKSCASGNINVCNHCNVYIYNKLYEVPSEPCGKILSSGGYGNEGTPNGAARGGPYDARNPTTGGADQQFPVAELP